MKNQCNITGVRSLKIRGIQLIFFPIFRSSDKNVLGLNIFFTYVF